MMRVVAPVCHLPSHVTWAGHLTFLSSSSFFYKIKWFHIISRVILSSKIIYFYIVGGSHTFVKHVQLTTVCHMEDINNTNMLTLGSLRS